MSGLIRTPDHSAYSESVRRHRVCGGVGRARPVRPDAGPKHPVVDRSTSQSQNDVNLNELPRHVTFPAILLILMNTSGLPNLHPV